MADVIYNRFLANLSNKEIDLEADTIKCAILDNGHTPDPDHNVWADVSGDEVSGTGYTTGGQDLAGKSVTEDDTNDLAKFDADNVIWSTVTLVNARYAVLYDDSVSGDPLIAIFDFGSDQSPSAEDFTVQWDSSGILNFEQGT